VHAPYVIRLTNGRHLSAYGAGTAMCKRGDRKTGRKGRNCMWQMLRRSRMYCWPTCLIATLLLSASGARAGNLTDIFKNELAGLEMEPLGPALANTVASTYPVASASSSVIYVYNAQLETFERRTGVLGPIIGERVETIGKGQINLGVSYSHVNISSINGQGLDHLVNVPVINGRVVSFPVPGGARVCGDPTCSYEQSRFTNFLPVLVQASMNVTANIWGPSVTYGITPDLDVNLTLPVVQTFLGVQVHETVPDPRLPQFTLRVCDPTLPEDDPLHCAPGETPGIEPMQIDRQAFGQSTGFGDLLLRGKYAFLRSQWVDLAAGLGVSFPTGNADDLHGTGTYRVEPALIASKVVAERFEPLLNLGVGINANDVSRSVFNWAVGGTAQVYGPLTGALVFLGRNEFNAQSDPISAPFFFQIERNDIYDISMGMRLLFAESGVISGNVIVPLNNDGLRANAIPTIEVQYAF
jgi:hypothetical protein